MGHSLAAQWTINGRITSQEGKAITQAEIFFPDFNMILGPSISILMTALTA
jgi:hypothetical protein